MPTFPAPEPVAAVVDLPVGRLHVIASERDDVVVTVLPDDPGKAADARAAQETTVAFTDGVLTVNGPATWKQYLPFTTGALTVTIELPAGSNLSGKSTAGWLYTEGPLGHVDAKVTAGDARVEAADRLDLRVSAGSVVVGRTAGPSNLRATAGSVRVREIAGDATVKCSNGDTSIGTVTGYAEISGANGNITVGRVRGTVVAKAAYGGIRVDSVETGTVTLTTSYGSVEVGVAQGTAAHLDISSEHGTVRNLLEPTGGPVDHQATAEVHARTGYGDVVVRRPESVPV